MKRRKIYTSWERYQKMVEGLEYKGFRIKIDPVAKYPGEMISQYRYRLEKENTAEEIKNGASGYKTIYPFKLSGDFGMFTGFDSFDWRKQLTKKEVMDGLKKTVDKINSPQVALE